MVSHNVTRREVSPDSADPVSSVEHFNHVKLKKSKQIDIIISIILAKIKKLP